MLLICLHRNTIAVAILAQVTGSSWDWLYDGAANRGDFMVGVLWGKVGSGKNLNILSGCGAACSGGTALCSDGRAESAWSISRSSGDASWGGGRATESPECREASA